MSGIVTLLKPNNMHAEYGTQAVELAQAVQADISFFLPCLPVPIVEDLIAQVQLKAGSDLGRLHQWCTRNLPKNW